MSYTHTPCPICGKGRAQYYRKSARRLGSHRLHKRCYLATEYMNETQFEALIKNLRDPEIRARYLKHMKK